MKWFALIGMAVVLTVAGCSRQDTVHAGGDGAREYPPTATPVDADKVQGELRSVDLKKKRIVIRVENGMEQTFKFGESTTVAGLHANAKASPRALVGKEGSEVVISCNGEKGEKLATAIDVTSVFSRKARRR
jgi:hypothetical protein